MKHILTIIFASSATIPTSASTLLFLRENSGVRLGIAENEIIRPDAGFEFIVGRNFDDGIRFSINDFSSNPTFQGRRSWRLDFAAPGDGLLGVGSFPVATRFPFQNISDAGFSFTGNGRGFNTLDASFEILEVSYSESGEVLTFAADFIQIGFSSPTFDGGIRFNSLIPIPEPSSTLLFGLGVLGFVTHRRRLS